MKITVVKKSGWTVSEWMAESWRIYLCSGQQHGWCKRSGHCRNRIRQRLSSDTVTWLSQCRRFRREIRIEEVREK